MDWLRSVFDSLESNQVFSGGFAVMIVGAALAYARNLPALLWRGLRRRLIVELDVPSGGEAFEWVNRWLAEQTYSKDKARLLTVSTRRERRDSMPDAAPAGYSRPEIELAPAPGLHWLWFRGRPLLVTRVRQKAEKGEFLHGIREEFQLRLLSRNRQLMRDLLEEARELSCPKDDIRISIFTADYGRWEFLTKRLPRSLDSVVWRTGKLEGINKRIATFLKSKKSYSDRGAPWRIGFGFYGPPGSGKTSAITGLASENGLDIYIADLSNPSINDATIRGLFSRIPPNALILMEDVDHALKNREENAAALTLAGIFNAIDGICTAEGQVLVITTNSPDELPEAMIRPGRIDHMVNVPNADRDQAGRLFDRFFPDAEPMYRSQFLAYVPNDELSMAYLQGLMLQHETNAKDCVDQLVADRIARPHDGPACERLHEQPNACATCIVRDYCVERPTILQLPTQEEQRLCNNQATA